MMVQALILLPRLVVVPSHRAAVRHFTALSEDGGRPARGVEQLLGTMNTAQARGASVQMCSAPRCSDREMLLAAVQLPGRYGLPLYHASAELQADREVVLAAVQQYGLALSHASPELQADREVVLAAVQQHAYALMHASSEMRADREVVLAAVQQDADTLRYASAELRADREVVLAAVQQDAGALRDASAELWSDRDFMLAAVQQDPRPEALGYSSYSSAERQRDISAVLKAARYHIFNDLDRLADRGQLKVLRTLASVQECGRQLNNCLADYDLAQCSCHILVKLDGDDGIPLAVGSFANGEWEEIRYANDEDARRGGNRACGRSGSAALPPANSEEILGQFDAFLPALHAFQLELETTH